MGIRDEFYDSKEIYYKQGYDYYEAFKLTCQQWIDEEKYKKLFDYFVAEFEGSYSKRVDLFIEKFIQKGQKKLYHKYWNFLFNEALHTFWLYVNYCTEKSREISTEKFLSYDKKIIEENHNKYPRDQDPYLNFIYNWYETLKFIDIYIERMQRINATEDIERAKFLKECVFNLKKPRAKKTTDKRKMSEELFWELIQESREKSEFDSDFTEILKDKLEAMSATEIKKFQKLLLEKMNELNHWDIWALAYIVRKGCGDDAFDYFKAWVISKGKEAFEDVKDMKLDKLKKLFQESDPQLEEFMYVAQNAYADKKYDEMPIPRVKNQPIQGEEWNEEEVCKSYPKICEMFGYTS